MKLVGLAGPARSGKDTVAAMLVKNYGFKRDAFADPIKQTLKSLFNLTQLQMDGRDKDLKLPIWDVTPRYLFQTFGTDWARDMISQDIWVKHAQFRWMDTLARAAAKEGHSEDYYKGVVFSDVRFDNEAEWIRAQGGTIVRIDRIDRIRVEGHRSESGIKQYVGDLALRNMGTISELADEVESLTKYLR